MLLALILCSCSAPPRAYQMNDRIELGTYKITITGSDYHSYLNIPGAGDKAFLTIQFRVIRPAGEDAVRFYESYAKAFRVEDRDGNTYKAAPFPEFDPSMAWGGSFNPSEMLLDAIKDPEKSEREMKSKMSTIMATDRWQLYASVPPTAHGFTVRIENQDRQDDQASAALVDLRR